MLSYLNPEPASRNLHTSSDRWRSIFSESHDGPGGSRISWGALREGESYWLGSDPRLCVKIEGSFPLNGLFQLDSVSKRRVLPGPGEPGGRQLI
jgi:hypothetical protein